MFAFLYSCLIIEQQIMFVGNTTKIHKNILSWKYEKYILRVILLAVLAKIAEGEEILTM